MKLGWYSKETDRRTPRSIFWRNKEGKIVQVTEVSDLDKGPTCKWSDVYCVGEMVEYVKTINKPTSFNNALTPIGGYPVAENPPPSVDGVQFPSSSIIEKYLDLLK